MRLGFDCKYEDNRWTFVSHRPAHAGPSRSIGRRSSAQLSRTSSPGIPPNRNFLGTPAAQSLNRTAYQSRAIADFMSLYMPRDPPLSMYIGGVKTAPWMQSLLDLAGTDEVVKASMDALALTVAGRAFSDRVRLREGTRLYASALRDVNRRLQDATTAQTDAVLASCKLLALYVISSNVSPLC
jgi:hypothetical protein